MKTVEVRFDVFEEILDSLKQDINEFSQQSRLYTAMQLFKNHQLSLGKAAELAGIPKDEFITALDKLQIDLIAYETSELDILIANRFRVSQALYDKALELVSER